MPLSLPGEASSPGSREQGRLRRLTALGLSSYSSSLVPGIRCREGEGETLICTHVVGRRGQLRQLWGAEDSPQRGLSWPKCRCPHMAYDLTTSMKVALEGEHQATEVRSLRDLLVLSTLQPRTGEPRGVTYLPKVTHKLISEAHPTVAQHDRGPAGPPMHTAEGIC